MVWQSRQQGLRAYCHNMYTVPTAHWLSHCHGWCHKQFSRLHISTYDCIQEECLVLRGIEWDSDKYWGNGSFTEQIYSLNYPWEIAHFQALHRIHFVSAYKRILRTYKVFFTNQCYCCLWLMPQQWRKDFIEITVKDLRSNWVFYNQSSSRKFTIGYWSVRSFNKVSWYHLLEAYCDRRMSNKEL